VVLNAKNLKVVSSKNGNSVHKNNKTLYAKHAAPFSGLRIGVLYSCCRRSYRTSIENWLAWAVAIIVSHCLGRTILNCHFKVLEWWASFVFAMVESFNNCSHTVIAANY